MYTFHGYTYDHLLHRKFRKTSRILFNYILEFVCDVTTIAFCEYSSGAEANVTLFYSSVPIHVVT